MAALPEAGRRRNRIVHRSPAARFAGTAARETGFYTAVILLVVVAAFPFYWMLITAFKTNPDLYNISNIPFWFNEPPTLEHFKYLFDETLFGRWCLNSFIIGICVVGITLVTALPAGYSLARMGGTTGETLRIGIFLTYLVPTTLLFLPLSRIITMLGLQDSLWSLVLVYPTFTIPFCTWLLMGFFKTVPREIEEAAIVDGCSLLLAFLKMVLPLSVPAILTVVIFTFTLTMHWGELMAGALLASVPVAIAYNLFLDRFIAGITGGAVK